MDAIEKLKELFKRFPGIGPRQAERFVYFLLYSGKSFKKELAQAILDLEHASKKCSSCARYFIHKNGESVCKICRDPSRDKSTLLIVEKETDIDKIEKSGANYNGLYFVMQGTVSPLQDSSKHQNYISKLKNKLRKNPVHELIIAFSATFEAEYSAKFIEEELKKGPEFDSLNLSILGRGLSSGSEIEYADPETIKFALNNRLNL